MRAAVITAPGVADNLKIVSLTAVATSPTR